MGKLVGAQQRVQSARRLVSPRMAVQVGPASRGVGSLEASPRTADCTGRGFRAAEACYKGSVSLFLLGRHSSHRKLGSSNLSFGVRKWARVDLELQRTLRSTLVSAAPGLAT